MLARLAVSHHFLRVSKVAVRVGGQLDELSVVVPIAAWYLDGTGRLDYEEPALFRVESYPIGCSSRDDDEVSFVEGKETEH